MFCDTADHRSVTSPTDRYQRLRNALKGARLKGGWRQEDIAQALGKPQSYVSKVESRERMLDFIETLDYCTALHIAVDDLVVAVTDTVSVSLMTRGKKPM
jgi:transcriptional regulator with XRE-family HTH domain